MNCWHCSREIEIGAGKDRVGFREDCAGCGRSLHACRNCHFYDRAYNNSCREPVADLVADKERSNFCEYYRPATGRSITAAPPKSEAQKKLEALFKKKS
jgi:hypothetical protein